MLDNLTQRLSKVVKTLRGQTRLTEDNIQDALREVRMALLEADVALPVVKDFIQAVKTKAVGQEVISSLTPGQALVGVVHDELKLLMGGEHRGLDLAAQPPAVVLMAGLQGAGKTTTTGKLGKWLVERSNKKVLTVSADVYRPAAIQQLQTVAGQAGVDFFPSEVGQEPVAIARAALDHAKRHYYDVLLVDTAGRLAIDEAMMAEIKAIHGAVNPVETLFVVDAMLGQDAVNTARAFSEALPLTGVVLTKLDGDSRGGAALSVRHVTGKPLKFAGIGEKLSGFEEFHPERMASRILGMGDILGLIEDAKRGVDEESARELAKKLKSGKGFDLADFKEQIAQMRKMGGLASIMGMLPGMGKVSPDQMPDEKELAHMEAIVLSMTPAERKNPKLLTPQRKLRIANGSGNDIAVVNRFIKQFTQAQKMMKQMPGMMKGHGGFGKLGGLMGPGGGKFF